MPSDTNDPPRAEDNGRLSVVEKLGYGTGDMASNLYWKTLECFLVYFYTDVFGISAKATGTMMLVTRIWDAINDPIIGYVADRTKTSWGRFRPYLVWMSIPLATTGMLVFHTPDWSPTGKLVYAYATYSLLMLAYSAINIPYGALLGVITRNSLERTSVSTYRFVCAFLGGVFVQYYMLRFVEFFGRVPGVVDDTGNVVVDEATGFFWTMVLFSVIATFLFLIAFATTKERVQPEQESDSTLRPDWYFLRTSWKLHQLVLLGGVAVASMATALDLEVLSWVLGAYLVLSFVSLVVSYTTKICCSDAPDERSMLKTDVNNLVHNRPWIALSAFGLLHLTGATIRSGAILFYFKYFVGDATYVPAFLACGTIAGVAGMLLTRRLTAIAGKKTLVIILKLLTASCIGAFYFVDPDQISVMFVINIVYGFVGGPVSALLWAMYADVTDYSAWKSGRRTTGLIFAAASFSQKLGCAIGAAMTGFALDFFQYIPPVGGMDQVQGEFTAWGLKVMISMLPAGFAIVSTGFLLCYPLNEHVLNSVESDLKGRSAAK